MDTGSFQGVKRGADLPPPSSAMSRRGEATPAPHGAGTTVSWIDLYFAARSDNGDITHGRKICPKKKIMPRICPSSKKHEMGSKAVRGEDFSLLHGDHIESESSDNSRELCNFILKQKDSSYCFKSES
jgi:hypothetical protein